MVQVMELENNASVLPSAQNSLSGSPEDEIGRMPPERVGESERFDFVKKRRRPEAVVIGSNDEVLFVSNGEGATEKFLAGKFQSSEDHQSRKKILDLLHLVRRSVLTNEHKPEMHQPSPPSSIVFPFRGRVIALRGLLLKGRDGVEPLVMVLIEQVKDVSRSSDAELPDYYFTPRENAVVGYIKKGFTNKEIASALEISVHTIKDHIKRIMNKVGVNTRCGIVGKMITR